jgi:hypothetical protein
MCACAYASLVGVGSTLDGCLASWVDFICKISPSCLLMHFFTIAGRDIPSKDHIKRQHFCTCNFKTILSCYSRISSQGGAVPPTPTCLWPCAGTVSRILTVIHNTWRYAPQPKFLHAICLYDQVHYNAELRAVLFQLGVWFFSFSCDFSFTVTVCKFLFFCFSCDFSLIQLLLIPRKRE